MLGRMEAARMWHVCMTSFLHVPCAILEAKKKKKKSRIISVGPWQIRVLTLIVDAICPPPRRAALCDRAVGRGVQPELLNEAMAGKLLCEGGEGRRRIHLTWCVWWPWILHVSLAEASAGELTVLVVKLCRCRGGRCRRRAQPEPGTSTWRCALSPPQGLQEVMISSGVSLKWKER